MKTPLAALLALTLATAGVATAGGCGGESPGPLKHQITGLFADSRERALRDALAEIPGIKLVGLDLEEAEALLEYDPARQGDCATMGNLGG